MKEGAGIAFLCYAPNTSIVAVPIASADVAFMFEEVTSDYQTITIQGQMTYRITDYKKITSNLDYTYDLKNRRVLHDNGKIIAQRLINIARVLIKKHIEGMDIRDAIRASDNLAKCVSEELDQNREIVTLGVEVIGFSVLAIQPNKETARALEAQAREEILKKADDALYERRNASIEQERKVKENELNTEITIETKRKEIQDRKQDTELAAEIKKKEILTAQQDAQITAELKKQEIQEAQLEARRLAALKENEIKLQDLQSSIEREEKQRELTAFFVENTKERADAKAYELAEMMKAFVSAFEGMNPEVMRSLANIDMQPNKMIAMAFRELASSAGKIGQLNISPDLLQNLLGN